MSKKKLLIVLVFQVLFFANAFSQYNKFMIAWYDYSSVQSTPITTMVQRYKDMQTHNINCAILFCRLTHSSISVVNLQYASSNPSKAFMDSAYKYVKILLTTPDNSVLHNTGIPFGSNPYNSITSQEGLVYWGYHPALWGFFIMDEPYNQSYFPYILPHANDIRTFNSNLLRFVNLPPKCCGMNYSGYEQFIQDYINATQPQMLSFDHYPIMDTLKPDWYNGLFYDLDIMSRKSAENKIPFMYILSSLGRNKNMTWLIYNEYVTSYFVYAGLFYGAKGLTYWNSYYHISNFPPIHKEFIKKVNKKIIDSENLLLSLEFKSAYHKNVMSTIRPGIDSIPSHAKWLNFSSDVWANQIFNTSNPFTTLNGSSIDSLAVSFMTDNFGNSFFWIFNKSLSSTEIIKLNLVNGSGVVDILSGNYCLLSDSTYFQFEPAEAKLFRFIPNKDVPTTNKITVNTTWNSNQNLYEDIIISNNAMLTINNCTLSFFDKAKITVNAGSRLIINNSTLTNSCTENLWQGITVNGTAQNRGIVQILNNGKIECAKTGITVNANGSVSAINANFVNCSYGVIFRPNASGSFKLTKFELNDDYPGESGASSYGDKRDFRAHISASGGAITVEGCTLARLPIHLSVICITAALTHLALI